MEELTQEQQFVIWYERICRDRDYAATWFDLLDRVGKDREMLDWIESNLFSVVMDRIGSVGKKESVEVEYETEDGRWITVRGRNLRDAIRKAMRGEK